MYLRGLAASVVWPVGHRSATFPFKGADLSYFYHRYNWTWLNERSVEIPIAFQLLDQKNARRVLEVGNVLSHYREGLHHEVVDRYETGDPRVINCDARHFAPAERYDLILSLSTLEHVGWDELPRDSHKAWETIQHLRSLLSPQGTFLFTVPAGYHPQLQQTLIDSADEWGELHAIRRISWRNEWQECSPQEAARCAFGQPYPFANAVFVGVAGSGAIG